MEDMHIHLKKGIYDQNIFDMYVKKCLEMNLDKVVFLDHGNRISKKHTPVLNTKGAIDCLKNRIDNYKNKDIIILKGIEIDYSNDPDFRKETKKILNYGNFDWVVGGIHSMKFESLKDYLECVKDMINNYDINAIAHLKPSSDYKHNESLLVDILKTCHDKNISIEINTSDRSIWCDDLLYYFLDLFKEYNVNYIYGSDAHSFEEIAHNIKETQEKVLKWTKRK